MKKFRVYKHPDNRIESVKVGISIPGLLFSGLWLLWHRIWVYASIVIIIGLSVYFIFPSPEGYLLGVPYGHRFGLADFINIALEIIVGIFGNEWRMDTLKSRGFELVDTVMASTPDDAKAKYLRKKDNLGVNNKNEPTHIIDTWKFHE